MAPADDVTLGEISRGLTSLEGRMNVKFNDLNHRLDTMEFVPRGEHALVVDELKSRISVLEDGKKWISRTLVASFLYPLLLAVVVTLVVTK